MGGLLDNLGALVLQYPAWSHWIIAAGILIQGELAILVSVFLIANNSLSWGGFIVPALSAAIIGDILLYFLGRVLRNTRFGWKLYKKIKHNRRAQLYFFYVRENVNKLLIASKFLLGTNILAVFAISWSKVKFSKFLKSKFIGLLLWFFPMTAIAYFFASGLTYLRSEKIFHQMEIGVAIVVVLIFGGEYLLRRIINKSFGLKSKAEEIGDALKEKL